MYGTTLRVAAAATLLAMAAPASQAQTGHHPVLHVNPRWEQCAIQLSPQLTQSAWRQFTREAGLVAYFRPLVDARPMGRGKVEVSLLQWQTAIDDMTSAWNDTFVHPYDTHWLYESPNGLAFPGLAVRAGVTSKLDVGVYATKNLQSNYGFVAAQAQYSLLRDEERNWDLAGRVSASSLFGPEDVDLRTAGADALLSRRYAVTSWATVSPYAGVSAFLANSHEKTTVVNLADETAGGLQAMLGAVVQVSKVRLAAEFNTARVNSRSLKVGVAF